MHALSTTSASAHPAGNVVRVVIAAIVIGSGSVCGIASTTSRDSHDATDPAIALARSDAVVPAGHAESRARYRQALALKQYKEAELAAKQLLQRDILEGRQASPGYADALCDLAYAQRQLGETETALTNYAAAVRTIEEIEGRLSERLVKPLYGAGMTYLAADRADLAIPFFDRSLHTIHVNAGPHTLQQTYVIESEIEAFDRLQDGGMVNALAVRLYNLHSREFGEDGVQMVPVNMKVGAIYGRLGLYTEERGAYVRAADIIKTEQGDESLTLIDPYIAIARTYLFHRPERQFLTPEIDDSGETWLRRALQITERNAQTDWQTESRVKLALADYYTIIGRSKNARKYYQQVWALLSQDPGYLSERQRSLEQVVALLEPDAGDNDAVPGGVSGESGRSPNVGQMTAVYAIDADGRVRDVRIIRSEPAGQNEVESRLKHSLESSVYRPRYENGVAVESIDRQFTYTFVYEKDDD